MAATTITDRARHARADAQAALVDHSLGAETVARVLEPSPPTVREGPYFADDPVDRGDVPSGIRVVSPVSTGDLRWSDVIGEDERLRAWAAERWLVPGRRLTALPESFEATRDSLHRLAVYVLSPARSAANDKIGLRWTLGGFGTPFFGDDEQVRVDGSTLVRQRGTRFSATPITTIADAAAFAGVDPPLDAPAQADVPEPGDPTAQLPVDAEAVAHLGDWYGLGAWVLEELRATSDPSAAPDRVQLWPEHFDLALTHGRPGETDDDYGARANYGMSPGDSTIAEPYAYVGPWTPLEGDFWNAESFPGAVLLHGDLVGVEDPRERVLEFFRTGARLVAEAHS